jgi:hypothetical protein
MARIRAGPASLMRRGERSRRRGSLRQYQRPARASSCRSQIRRAALGDVRHLAAGSHRLLEGGKSTGCTLTGTSAVEDGAAQLPRYLLVGLAQGAEPLQQNEPLDLLGKDAGIGRGNQRPWE